MNYWLKFGIWVAVIGIVFAIAWRKGYLARLTNYIRDTREELKKCTWPTLAELKGSTVVVVIAIVMLGTFTVALDFVVGYLIKALII